MVAGRRTQAGGRRGRRRERRVKNWGEGLSGAEATAQPHKRMGSSCWWNTAGSLVDVTGWMGLDGNQPGMPVVPHLCVLRRMAGMGWLCLLKPDRVKLVTRSPPCAALCNHTATHRGVNNGDVGLWRLTSEANRFDDVVRSVDQDAHACVWIPEIERVGRRGEGGGRRVMPKLQV